jgi:hypothetical protein
VEATSRREACLFLGQTSWTDGLMYFVSFGLPSPRPQARGGGGAGALVQAAAVVQGARAPHAADNPRRRGTDPPPRPRLRRFHRRRKRGAEGEVTHRGKCWKWVQWGLCIEVYVPITPDAGDPIPRPGLDAEGGEGPGGEQKERSFNGVSAGEKCSVSCDGPNLGDFVWLFIYQYRSPAPAPMPMVPRLTEAGSRRRGHPPG